MPGDLFGDVTDPSIKVGSRKWYTVPLSLLVHSFVLAAVIVVPLMATGALPLPTDNPIVMPVVKAPVPPPPAVRRAEAEQINVNRDTAPIDTPPTIEPETDLKAGFESEVPGASVESLGVFGDVDALTAPPVVEKPPVEPPRVVRPGGDIRQPTKIHDVAPVYPPVAQSARIEGVVIIEATISVDGRVRDARVLRSAPLLDEAALAAVREWIYTPTMLNGQPVSVVMTVTVRFQLK